MYIEIHVCLLHIGSLKKKTVLERAAPDIPYLTYMRGKLNSI